MFSIKTKLIVSYTLVFGILIIGYSVYIHQRIRESAIENLDTRIESFSERFEAELEEQMQHRNLLSVNAVMEARKETQERFPFRLADTSGQILYSDSVLLNIPMDVYSRENTGNLHFDILHCGTASYRTARSILNLDDRNNVVMHIAAPMLEIETSLRRLRLIFFLTIPFALILSAGAAYFITRLGFHPMTVMVESVKTISEKNLNQRLPVPRSNDEVRTLGIAFNTMLERIAKAFHSQKQFIADASHEIRTPLTIISSELEFALRNISSGTSKESIELSLGEVDHLQRLTSNLLLLTKLDSDQVQLQTAIFRLDELLLDCVRKMKHIAQKRGVRFDVHIDVATEVTGDEEKIGSVILIVLDNALHYCFENSTVTLRLHSVTSGTVAFDVINSGEGILPEDIPLLFHRFYRGSAHRSDTHGSGLGLSIAKQIMDLHHGRIEVTSIPNKTTTFSIEIPCS